MVHSPASRRTVILLALAVGLLSLSSCGVAATSGPNGNTAAHRPAKRSYDTHSYYVMQLTEGSDEHEAQVLAGMLGAELVEQVGELKDHWLLRAPFDLKTKRAIQNEGQQGVEEHDRVMQAYYNIAIDQQDLRNAQPVNWIREHVTNQPHAHGQLLANIRSRSEVPQARSLTPRNIISVEKQVLRKRVKRQMNIDPSQLVPRIRKRADGSGADNTLSQYLRDIADRFAIADPLWPKQWHLANDRMQENSINVTGVWDQGITGKGVRVAIVDDGLDMYSGDLEGNFDPEGSWDFNDHTDLPKPRLADDQHGTRCAGEIAAAKNDICGVGVAYDAKVAGIRILSASISDADEAASLNFGYQTNDIYSCSWGPPDDGRSMEAPSPLIYKSMLNGVQNGRGGKGSIFVFASGNGGAVDDQCNFDGYTNSIFSITISAIDRKGLHPYYSEGCSANMVVTYSSGSGDSIHTTDVGKNKCSDHHGGTSAAAPIAAGIFALVLQVRPELTWRDMQHMCVQTAIQVNTKDPDWQVTAAGRPYNHKYGYGKLDAYRIVELAKTFEPVKPQAWFSVAKQLVNKKMTKDGVGSSITISPADLEVSNLESLEHITVQIKARHGRRGNMEVILESPNGVRSILARPRRFDSDTGGFPDWTFMSVKHWDENPLGDWTLTMRDRQTNGKNGTFVSWSMTLWGQSKDASLAKPYKMVDDDQIHLPAPPHHKPTGNYTLTTITRTEGDATITETSTIYASDHAPTKSYAKPTAHLPGDHHEAEGESDLPFDEDLTSATSSIRPWNPAATTAELQPTATPASDDEASDAEEDNGISDKVEEEQEEEDDAYLGPWSSLVGDSTWFYGAIGTVVIFLGAAGAYFLVRRRQQRLTGGSGRRGGAAAGGAFGGLFSGYGLLSGRDDDDTLPMSAMEGGGVARSRALYDAFALDDSSDDEEDGIVGGSRGEHATRGIGSGSGLEGDRSREMDGEGRSLIAGQARSPLDSRERLDDSYMSNYLGDDDDDDDNKDEDDNGRKAPSRPSDEIDRSRESLERTPRLGDGQTRYTDDSP